MCDTIYQVNRAPSGLHTAVMDIIVAVALVLALISLALAANLRRSRLPLPPGPKQLPVIGNLLDVSVSKPWVAYHKWSQDSSETDPLLLTKQLLKYFN